MALYGMTLATLSMASKQSDINFSSAHHKVKVQMSCRDLPQMIMFQVLSVKSTDSQDSNRKGLHIFHGLLIAGRQWYVLQVMPEAYSRWPKIVVVDCATMLWVDIACITFTRQSITNHEPSESHKGAGIVQALSNVESAGRKVMTSA